MFETGKIEHLLAAIDNIVNGEVNLPPGDQTKLFERIRQVGKGYTVVGTNYTYNSRNQLVHRENLIRYEAYDYKYDEAGNLLTDSRSKYEWDARGHLTKVTFPDGFGEKYVYDMQGRRISKTQFNHQGETQQTTNYHYKGDTWVLTEEVHSGGDDGEDDGESDKTYTYDANDRPLSITFRGETFWYVYNGHGDVTALTDKDGNVAARYEYDAWGLVTGMYNRIGERVREGMGWIGDLGSGNGSPGSLQGPEDSSGNTVPDYHPGNGKGNGQGQGKTDKAASSGSTGETLSTSDTAESQTLDEALADVIAADTEATDDITTDLVKENPIRYAGYYWDRKTQYYYLQARYYDPRPARFISEDTYEGEISNPLTLNLYTYVSNNPLSYSDPSGHMAKQLLNQIFAAFAKRQDTGYMIKTVIAQNKDADYGRYQSFHEIAQVVAGRYIHSKTGLATQLEYRLTEETPWYLPNKYYWVDIITSDFHMWEVKPRQNVYDFRTSIDGLYENAEQQLDKYASLNEKLMRGQMFGDILGVKIVEDLRMNIDFFDKGKIVYDFYLETAGGKINLNTRQAAVYVADNFDYGFDITELLSEVIDLKPGKGKR